MRHFLNLVQDEREVARRTSDPIVSYHEGYAIILEAFRSLEQDIFTPDDRRNKDALLSELVQIAALCFRFAEDRGLLWDGNAREPLEVSDGRKHTD